MDNNGYVTRFLKLGDTDLAQLFGAHDELLKAIERNFTDVRFHARGNELTIVGSSSETAAVERIITQLQARVRSSRALSVRDIDELLAAERLTALDAGAHQRPGEKVQLSEAILTVRGKEIRPQTAGQREYVRAIDSHTVTFGIGPAGTGKTYLAMAQAVRALQRREVSKIVLTRPAVEAGERLGYLPGSLEEKIDPYLRPLFDAIGSMLDADAIPQLMASGTIEVAPLAYMRGRTLNEAFIILDEAQNTTPEQMKMFLTRLGYESKMVITGDLTQVDLPRVPSGLRVVTRILNEVPDIAFAHLTSDDIVRHSLVGRIVDAYEAYESARGESEMPERRP